LADLEDLSDGDEEAEDANIPFGDQMDDLDDIEALNYDNLEAVAHLIKTNRYKRVVAVRPLELPHRENVSLPHRILGWRRR
jgi:hypothetical protein